jgi:hypothetical protein
MGKFTDIIKKASQVGAKPMGFRAAVPAQNRSRLLLVAALTEIEGAADLATGADIALLPVTKTTAKSVDKVCKAKTDISWGARLKASGAEAAKPAVEAGCDFVVFPPDTTFTTLKSEAARVLEVDSEIEDGLLRSAGDLPLDAVFLRPDESDDYRLTWAHLMLIHECAEIAGKPLLVMVPADISGDGLLALWEAGALGVVVTAAAARPKAVAELRELIDKQAFSAPGKRRKAAPSVPYISGAPESPAEEEEEEDE